jgi:hypothetical protein
MRILLGIPVVAILVVAAWASISTVTKQHGATLVWCRVKPDWQVKSRFSRDHSCPFARMAQEGRAQCPHI